MKTTVLIPCHNEEKTIGQVVADFRRELPGTEIIVGDNASTDGSAGAARAAGAGVVREERLGKGHMVQRLLREVESEYYLMVDGDGTYRAKDGVAILAPVLAGKCDMCIGNRLAEFEAKSFGNFHFFGNKLIRFLTYRLHRVEIPDMLSGFRAFNRRTARELNLIMGGFEIETEINIKCVRQGLRLCSVDTAYGRRQAGSVSKLKTIQDGYRILLTILMLLREHQPMTLGGVLFLALNISGLILIVSGVIGGSGWLFGLGLLASLTGSVALAGGVILHSLNIAHRETEERLRRLGSEYSERSAQDQ
jgi:glycosyltransferase involved in cell wall biosynthesis